MANQREIDTRGLEATITGLPGFAEVRAAAREANVDAYIVGGAVRDALLGVRGAELDVVVDGDHLAVADRLGGPVRDHARFLTASVQTPFGMVDVARSRRERYPRPGALPEVEPAGLGEDLDRRDFSVNAIAVCVERPGEPVDPHRGETDLRAGVLRALHDDSLADDPTRALRGARYAARLDLEPDPPTLAQLEGARLNTVSTDRVDAELARTARERRPAPAFALLAAWGLFELPQHALELIDDLAALLADPPWAELTVAEVAIPRVVRGELRGSRALAAANPRLPSEAVRLARGHDGPELAIARALGAEWLERYVTEWRHVRPQVTGEDLLRAGVPQGPGIGAGLAEALRASLDGEAGDRDAQLEVALAAARDSAAGRD